MTQSNLPRCKSPRFLVGCAGQFMLYEDGSGHLTGTTDDVDEAFVMCLSGPAGCEVYDLQEKRWLGPSCMEEIEEAQARLEARREANTVAPGDWFQQVMPYGRDMLEVESWVDGERVAVRRRSGGRQVFPISTLLNPVYWVRVAK